MGQSGSFWRRRVPWWRWAIWGLCAAVALGFGWNLRSRMALMASSAEPDRMIGGGGGGTLVIAGGGELPPQIRSRFVELAGGGKARLVMIPAAAVDLERQLAYGETWRMLGAADVKVLAAESRAEADDPEFSAAIENATGVWLGGGEQSWLMQLYGGTLVEQRVREVLERGGVVGGTSAGAAVMCDVMIAGGRDEPKLSRGMGLWDGVLVDQHFLRRNRWQRMHRALESHPDLVGLGIDEETALVVESGTGRFAVIGKSYVVASVSAKESRSARVEFLRAGDAFDLRSLRDGAPLGMRPTDFEALLLGD